MNIRSKRGNAITKSYGNIRNWEAAQWRAQEAREIEDRVRAVREASHATLTAAPDAYVTKHDPPMRLDPIAFEKA